MKGVPDECVTTHKKPRFTVREKRSEVSFENPFGCEVEEVQVDGCVFDSTNGKRCDYFLNVPEANESIFVELKGGDIEKAVLQLEATKKYLIEVLKVELNKRVIWIISYSKSPSFATNRQKLVDNIRKNHLATPVIKSSPVHYTISSPKP